MNLEKLREKYSYDEELGVLKNKKGRVIGYTSQEGYRKAYIFGKYLYLHRVIFFYVHGYLPDLIDHIDRNKLNNRVSNLREASKSENCLNSSKRITNTSGYKNVVWHKVAKKWRAQVTVNKKRVHVGLFDSPEEAYQALKDGGFEQYG